MSPGSPCDAVVSAGLELAFPWYAFHRQAIQPGILFQPDTIFQHTSLLQIGTMIPYSSVSFASVSSQLVRKC